MNNLFSWLAQGRRLRVFALTAAFAVSVAAWAIAEATIGRAAAIWAAGATFAGCLIALFASRLGLRAKNRLAALSAEIEELRRGAAAQIQRQAADVQKTAQLIASIQQSANDARFLVEQRTNAAQVALDQLNSRLLEERRETKLAQKEALNRFKKIDAKLSNKASDAKLVALEEHLSALARKSAELSEDVSLMKGYHVHNRVLSRADIKSLQSNWVVPFGLEVKDTHIGYMAARVAAIESHCVGRLATSSETMIARILAAQSIEGPQLRVLEIGVLFGVASACFNDMCADRRASFHMTLIDPFEGYYGKTAADLITGVPVTRSAMENNFAALGIPKSNYSVIEGLSTDQDIIDALKSSEFDLLLIDGDHSYEGVRADFLNFAPLIRPGGIILFDDYEVNEWPDIKRFVDETALGDSRLERVATGYRTAAFRVVSRIERA